MACAKRLRDEYVAPAPVHHTRAHAQISPKRPLLCPNPAVHGDGLVSPAASAAAGPGLSAAETGAVTMGAAATGAAADAQLATEAAAGAEPGEVAAAAEAHAGSGAKAAAAVAAAPGPGGEARSELQAVRFFDDSRLEVLGKVRWRRFVHTRVAVT